MRQCIIAACVFAGTLTSAVSPLSAGGVSEPLPQRAAGTSGREPDQETGLVVVTADHPIHAGAEGLPHVEPHVAADPNDVDRLLAGAIVVSPDPEGPWHCSAFLSMDAGRSWSRHDFPMERCIDPWALITSTGELLIAGIEIKRDLSGSERFRLVLFRSDDNGETWAGPLDLGRSHDHEVMIQEPNGDVLLVSRRAIRSDEGFPRHAFALLRSRDNGRSFEPFTEMLESNLAQNATGLVRLSDGTLVVTYIDFQRNVDGFESQGMLQQPRAWALRSSDGGRSFSIPLFVSEGCGSTDGFAGYPALAADASDGPFRDRLYHLCVRADFDGLALTRSDSRAEIWSAPLRIDGPPAGEGGHVRTPMLAVNGEGVVAAAWYDRRNDPERRCQDTYVTYSRDGGASFVEPVRVSGKNSCPESPGNGRVSHSWPMGGDYGSLTASIDGRFHVLWADSRTGLFQLRHAAFGIELPATQSEPARKDARGPE